MLETALAEKLVQQVTEFTSYNVNIMNEKGIIIASRDRERIGTFHEAAYQILTGESDMIIVSGDNDYSGTLRGMNMVIEIDGAREGVVGVTGDPDEIRPVALIIKMAMETMIKYENQKMQSIRRQSKKERFMEMLTREKNADPEHLRRLARKLKYREDIVRIPILCCLESGTCGESLLRSVKGGRAHRSEDITFSLDERHVLIFKTMDKCGIHLFSDYKFMIGDYLRTTLQWLRREEIVCRFYVGTFQNSFVRYYSAYQHCCWLEKQFPQGHMAVYFYDHVGQYMQDMIPRQELYQVFNVHGTSLSDEFQKNYLELTRSLLENDFRISDAAAQVFMHKNTFTYRYNKIRDVLDVNPQKSSEDKWFLACLYRYFLECARS